MKGGANMDDYTRKFNAAEDKDQQVHYILTTVYESLKEKGYDPINQIVGYILSADPTITNHNSARTLICKIDRDELLPGAGQELSGAVKAVTKMPRGYAVRHFAPVFPVPTAFSEFFLPVRVDSRCQMCYNSVTKFSMEVLSWQT